MPFALLFHLLIHCGQSFKEKGDISFFKNGLAHSSHNCDIMVTVKLCFLEGYANKKL